MYEQLSPLSELICRWAGYGIPHNSWKTGSLLLSKQFVTIIVSQKHEIIIIKL